MYRHKTNSCRSTSLEDLWKVGLTAPSINLVPCVRFILLKDETNSQRSNFLRLALIPEWWDSVSYLTATRSAPEPGFIPNEVNSKLDVICPGFRRTSIFDIHTHTFKANPANVLKLFLWVFCVFTMLPVDMLERIFVMNVNKPTTCRPPCFLQEWSARGQQVNFKSL